MADRKKRNSVLIRPAGGFVMILFCIKVYRTLKRIIASRHAPRQLAGAIALGVLLGVIPHGNLTAVVVLLGILCLRINHAAMGLVAIAVTMVAHRLDPVTHVIGEWVLGIPAVAALGTRMWTAPLVPWTDLNNTVVAGSLILGIASLLPIYGLTYPVMVRWSRWKSRSERRLERELEADLETDSIDSGVAAPIAPVRSIPLEPAMPTVATEGSPMIPVTDPIEVSASHPLPIDPSTINPSTINPPPQPINESASPSIADPPDHVVVPVQTRVDILRFDEAGHTSAPHVNADRPPTAVVASRPTRPPVDIRDASSDARDATSSHRDASGNDRDAATDHRDAAGEMIFKPINDPAAMDEALNYLLRQLRDSKVGDAA